RWAPQQEQAVRTADARLRRGPARPRRPPAPGPPHPGLPRAAARGGRPGPGAAPPRAAAARPAGPSAGRAGAGGGAGGGPGDEGPLAVVRADAAAGAGLVLAGLLLLAGAWPRRAPAGPGRRRLTLLLLWVGAAALGCLWLPAGVRDLARWPLAAGCLVALAR